MDTLLHRLTEQADGIRDRAHDTNFTSLFGYGLSESLFAAYGVPIAFTNFEAPEKEIWEHETALRLLFLCEFSA